jgi:phosphomannomutase
VARLFGTDGIRGIANVDLKPTLAYALGRATAHELLGARPIRVRLAGRLTVGARTWTPGANPSTSTVTENV